MSLIFPKKEILYAPMLGTLGGGSARGFGRGGGGGLYDFTSFIFFGLAGEEEWRGITYADAISQYQSFHSSQDWYLDTANFNITQRGYQLWTVPEDGNYRFTAKGAGGGYTTYGSNSPYRGGGGQVIGRFDLLKGDVVTIACGHKGHQGTSSLQGSGGGGTFVVMDGGNYSTANISDILLIAGGGGAGYGSNQANAHDSNGGNTGTLHRGGSSQQYPRQTILGEGGEGGRLTDGGGGFLSNGYQIGTADGASNHGYFGYGYRQGLNGGAGNTGPDSHACTGNNLGTLYGGFGGGSGGSYAANGAGGGFTGGSGNNGCDNGGGGGGANYINTSHPNFTGGQSYTAGGNVNRGEVEVVKMS